MIIEDKCNQSGLKPSIHKDFEMDTRIQVDASVYAHKPTGRIVGISSFDVFFIYIVLLDDPITVGKRTYRAISVMGNLIEEIP